VLTGLAGLAGAAACLGYAAVVYQRLRSSSELQAEITQTRSWLRCTPPWHLFAGLLVPALPLIAEITCMINGLLWPAEIPSRPWRRAR
jgi:hypothetical protein